jgi:ABC-type polysaccharide/polyol phosphate transport system ATPase subunit
MSQLPAIAVRGVSKDFKLYSNAVMGPLKEALLFWRKEKLHRAFRALDEVSFDVMPGEVVGIVGPNGAGKTTLLKMIAGLLPVDSGTIEVRGRVHALLALGVGVHPEFTGRENIRFGGLLMGLSEAEIAAKTPEIVEFAEIGEFIDRPLRTYSSGMRARLLFSIAMSVQPEILIVDEALATGDAYFVQKCGSRIRELCASGATILFVSHNLSQVEEICGRAILLIGGRIVAEGAPLEIVRAYNRWAFRGEIAKAAALPGGGPEPVGGDGSVRLLAARLLDHAGAPVAGAHTGERVTLEIAYESDHPPGSPATFFAGIVRATDMQWVGEISTRYYLDAATGTVRSQELALAEKGVIRVHLDPLLLLNNHYSFWVSMYQGTTRYAEYRGLAPFFVAREAHVFDRAPVFWQPCRFELADESRAERIRAEPVR